MTQVFSLRIWVVGDAIYEEAVVNASFRMDMEKLLLFSHVCV